MYKFDQEKFWAGTPGSYWAILDAQERFQEALASNTFAGKDSMKAFIDEMAGPVMTVEGSVAVVEVKGSLINGSAGFMRLYGALGYDDIREALTDALADKNVKSIMLRVDSGGGQVAGCQELGNYIREVDAQKPVVAHTDTAMCSAAYWLGSSARTVTAGSTAIVGSIGVLIVHQEISKMMADQGVTTTVIRSGKYKAIANRFEPLSDLAKEEMQAQVDDLDQTFTAYVADRRGVSVEVARRKMGQGREFLGARAVDAGLVDKLSTLSEAHAEAEVTASKRTNLRAGVASGSGQANNPANVHQGSVMKINLTTQQIAAIAAGATLESLGLPKADLEALQAAAAASQEGNPTGEPEGEQAPADNAQATNAGTQPAAEGNSQDFLRAELRDAYTTIGTLQAKVATLEASAEAGKAERNTLLNIARGSIGNMQVALGGANAAATLSDDQVAAEHTRLAAVFADKFPVGRVSATVAEQQVEKPAASVNHLFLAALAMGKK